MKTLLPIICCLFISSSAFGADTLVHFKESIKGKQIIGLSIGYPPVIAINAKGSSFISSKLIIPTYVNYEYGITSSIGLKLDMSFFEQETGYHFHNALKNYESDTSYKNLSIYNINPQASYYFFQNKRIMLAVTGGIAVRLANTTYSVVAYKSWKEQFIAQVFPTFKVGARIAFGDTPLALKLDIGYDAMSFIQLGFNYRL